MEYFKELNLRIPVGKATETEQIIHEAITYYCGNVYEIINRHLREIALLEKNSHLIKLIPTLQAFINKFKIQKDIIVFRRIFTGQHLSSLKKGHYFKDEGFMSTSLFVDTRINIADISDGNIARNEMLLYIRVPNGTNAIYLEEISSRGENETNKRTTNMRYCICFKIE